MCTYTNNDASGSIFRHGRNAGRRRVGADTRLVVSSHASHTATELCQSETSRGPDFISLIDGYFCDMETHEILPLCNSATNNSTECYYLDETAKVKRNGAQRRKSYTKILKWDP